MFLIKRDPDKNIDKIFYEGKETEEDYFELSVSDPKLLSLNNIPELIDYSKVIIPDNTDDDDESILNPEDRGFISILSTRGSIFDDNNKNTILIPSLIVDGDPVIINEFKWYKDDRFLDSQILYREVKSEDVEKSSIYEIEVVVTKDGERLVFSEEIELINITGIDSSIDDKEENGGGDEEEESIDSIRKVDFDSWGNLGESFVRSGDFKQQDYYRLYTDIKRGSDIRQAYMRTFKKVLERIGLESAKGNRDLNNIYPVKDVLKDVEYILLRAYPNVYE